MHLESIIMQCLEEESKRANRHKKVENILEVIGALSLFASIIALAYLGYGLGL